MSDSRTIITEAEAIKDQDVRQAADEYRRQLIAVAKAQDGAMPQTAVVTPSRQEERQADRDSTRPRARQAQ